MKLCFILTIVSLLQLSATGYSQNAAITLDDQKATIADVFRAIEKQTEYKIFYKNDQLDVNLASNINSGQIVVKDALSQMLTESDCGYMMFDRLIVITPKKEMLQQSVIITGTVTDEAGEPLPGVNVIIKGTSTGVVTGYDGKYSIDVPDRDAVLMFSFMGYTTQEIPAGDRTVIDLILEEDVRKIDEVVVIGYGSVKKQNGCISNCRKNKYFCQIVHNLIVMTKEEFLQIAGSRYDELDALKQHDNFYDYEKEFDRLWQELGRTCMEHQMNASSKTTDRRKKKR